ncbi:MAG: amino acid adenylation domain-containing protein [Chloroflexota bacterium]
MSRSTPNLTERKEQLSDAKRLLLEKRLKGRKSRSAGSVANPPAPHRIGLRPVDAPLAATFAQERLWFLQRLYPNSAAYNMHGVVRIRGRLDANRLARCINILIERHEILRTTFIVEGGQLVQSIHDASPLTLGRTDLSNEPATERFAHAMTLCVEEAQQPFDLEEGPLIRASLLKLGDEDIICRLTLHHIISDEWSTGILWREIARLYQQLESGATDDEAKQSLSALPIQYADYAHWQREQMAHTTAEKELSFWRIQLEGKLPQLQLPIDQTSRTNPQPSSHHQRGALITRRLPPALANQLQILSRTNETTLFVTLLSAFYVLLYRYTDQPDLLVGTPIANRNRPEIQSLLGFFINTLVLRGDLSENPSFLALLAQVRERTLNAIAHQELPFERIVQALQPDRDPNRNPLFQVMFVHQTDQTEQVSIPGLSLEPLRIDSQVAKFDLTLFVNESGDNLSTAIEFSTERFDQPDIERMLGHFEMLLQGMATAPEESIGSFSLLTDREKKQILGEWSGITKQMSANQIIAKHIPHSHSLPLPQTSPQPLVETEDDTVLIHHLIEAQAQRNPDKLALICGGVTLDYQTLERQANALADQIQAEGIGPNHFVALCLERSVEMIIAILGTLKAGGAYVPLDPAYPQERLTYMLEECGATILLTQQHLLNVLPTYNGTILAFSAEIWQISNQESASQQPPATSHQPPATNNQQLAYLIFTSGSSGKPKGTVVTHANLLHSTLARFEGYPAPVERFLLLSSFAFDSSVVGIFWSLVSGGTLVLPRQGEEKEIQQLALLIEEQQISHLLCLPSLYRALIDYTNPARLKSLDCAIVAGEACPPELVNRHFNQLPHTDLYNEYGPTEATVWSNLCTIQPTDATLPTIPIGRPIVNMQNYIVDAHQQPVPIGIPGELILSGLGITNGYLNRPDLTAEKFGQFTATSPQVLHSPLQYRTGDLVRWRNDGQIEFLGRLDHQVKLRGFRIELGEIESALYALSGIDDAAVLVSDQQLIAFIISANASEFSMERAQVELGENLPEHMIPTHFVPLDKFPTTPNGKIDRNQLTKMEVTPRLATHGFVPPADELEIQLAAIWETVLKVRPIGRQSHYFLLGGHSLQAIHLFQQIRERFGKDMPLATLFQAPTLAEQAELLRNEGWTPDWSALVPIQPHGTQRPLFCAHAVGGNVLSLRLLAEHLGQDQPFYALQSQGLDGKETIPERVEEIAGYYISEMRTVQPRGPYQLAGQSSGGLVAFEMANQLVSQGEEVSLLVLLDTYLPAHAFQNSEDIESTLKNGNGSENGNGSDSGKGDVVTAPSQSIPLVKRLQFHLDKVGQHGMHHLIQSACTRAVKVQVRTRHRIENRAVQRLYQYYEKRGEPLPLRWRPIYVRIAIEKALQRYHPPYYDGDVTLFRATGSLDAYLESVYGSHNGWEQFTSGLVQIIDIEGGHNLEQEPAVSTLADKLRELLGASQLRGKIVR